MKKVLIIGGYDKVNSCRLPDDCFDKVKETTLEIKNYRIELLRTIEISYLANGKQRLGKGGRARKRSKFKNK